MMPQQQTALTASTRIKRKICLVASVTLLGLSGQALAHVSYYDLNQGAQISDLTAAGKAASTAQYGETPAAILSLNTDISSLVDLPLNDQAKWNSTYQAYSGYGTFTDVTYSPTSSTATVDVTDVTGSGWFAGTTANLGNSHAVDFFNFRLSQTSNVSISWVVHKGVNYLNSAFSLYKGVLSYQSHDSSHDVLIPNDGIDYTQNPLDTGLANTADAQGIIGAFRDTLTNTTYVGQFNALNNWSQANNSGNWSAIEFIAAVNANAANIGTSAAGVLESITIQLAPGNYTIAASGGNQGGNTGLNGQLKFSATVVPLPGSVWLFISAMFVALGGGRCKIVADGRLCKKSVVN